MKRLKEFFGVMKNFFRHPVIGIDRILSSGIKWQLLFLLGVIVAFVHRNRMAYRQYSYY